MRSIATVPAILLLGLLPISPATTTGAEEPKQEGKEPTAAQILERMAKTYAGCKSYRDSGVGRTALRGVDVNVVQEKPFATAFVRPDKFRFEYTEVRPEKRISHYIVWRQGDDVRTWWDIQPGVKKPESLGFALAGATGVSGGTAHTVPNLLLPAEVQGRSLKDLAEATRIEDETLDKTECYRVKGKFGPFPVTVWIDKATYLVRRIDSEKVFPTFTSQETITYDPTLDGEVSEKLLAIGLPDDK